MKHFLLLMLIAHSIIFAMDNQLMSQYDAPVRLNSDLHNAMREFDADKIEIIFSNVSREDLLSIKNTFIPEQKRLYINALAELEQEKWAHRAAGTLAFCCGAAFVLSATTRFDDTTTAVAFISAVSFTALGYNLYTQWHEKSTKINQQHTAILNLIRVD